MRGLLARLAVAAGVALVVLVGLLLAILPSRGEERAGSVFSTRSAGLRALYLLCESLGFPVEPWSDAPARLVPARTLLVLSEMPEAPPPLPGARAKDGAPGPRRGRDLAHYRDFVERGGTLLVLGTGDEELGFLRDTLGMAELEGVQGESWSASDAPRDVVLVGDERLTLHEDVRRLLVGAREGEVLASAADGSPLVLSRAVGAGRVVLASFPVDWLDNGSLAEDGEPALLFVRLLERSGPFERVLFDEYALGGWRPAPVAGLAFSPRLAALSLHLALVLLLLGWRSAWSGPFPHDPSPQRVASPLARARGAGRLLARAGRFDLLARQLGQGCLRRWEARSGRGARGGDALEAAELGARLRALARGDEALLARLGAPFRSPPPADERELEALDAALRDAEARLFAPGETEKSARAPGTPAARTGS